MTAALTRSVPGDAGCRCGESKPGLAWCVRCNPPPGVLAPRPEAADFATVEAALAAMRCPDYDAECPACRVADRACAAVLAHVAAAEAQAARAQRLLDEERRENRERVAAAARSAVLTRDVTMLRDALAERDARDRERCERPDCEPYRGRGLQCPECPLPVETAEDLAAAWRRR